MKSIVFMLVLLMGSSYAHNTSESFEGLMDRHAEMVDNGDEFFLKLKYRSHEPDRFDGYVEVSAIIGAHMSETTYYGLNRMDMWPVGTERTEKIIDKLSPLDEPYFCATLTEYWSGRECDRQVRKLFRRSLDEADSVYMVKLEGDYYGNWEEYLVILINHETHESITMRFDILHEI